MVYAILHNTFIEETEMNIEHAKAELEKAYDMRCGRAAFSSIVRRNHDEIVLMSPDDKQQLLKNLGVPSTYYTELQKELGAVKYDRQRGYL